MLSKLYKLIFDVSICYAIGVILLGIFGHTNVSGGFFTVLLISILLSALLIHKRIVKIIVVIIVPTVYLILVTPAVLELAVFLLIWAYSLFNTMTEHEMVSRGRFVDMLKRFMLAFLVLPVLMLTSLHEMAAVLEAASPYIITAVVSAVFLLRQLRTDNQMEQMKQYRRQQFAQLTVFLLISLLLTLAKAPKYLLEGLKFLYLRLLVPLFSLLISLFGMLIGGIIYLILTAISFITKQDMPDIKVNPSNSISESTGTYYDRFTNFHWAAFLLYLLGVIAGLVLLFFFFRWLMGESFKLKTPAGVKETREYIEDTKSRRTAASKRKPREADALVRYYYGRLLYWLKHKRVELKSQDTTEDIDRKCCSLKEGTSGGEKEASAQLKQLYRKARYQTAEPVTKEEADKAKKLYQTIKTN